MLMKSRSNQFASTDEAKQTMPMPNPKGPKPKPLPIPYRHFLTLLRKCTNLTHLKQLQSHLLTAGHAHNQPFLFQLLRFAALSLSDLPYSRRLFDSLRNPNVYLYTAMLTAYSAHSRFLPSLQLFVQMLRRGRPKPTHFVYPLVLKSCYDRPHLPFVKLVHAHVSKSGFDGYSVVKTSLLDGYARLSELGVARKLFGELLERNRSVVSWTAFISGYARVGKMGNAIALFEEMPERDVPSWNAVIAGCTQNGLFAEAVSLFRRMVVSGEWPNQTTVSCVLSACGHLGMLRIGKSVHGYVFKKQIGGNSFVSNALVDMYGKCGSLKRARWIFDASSDKCLTAWNSMINCLALHGHSESAIATFKEMVMEGRKPDEVTFVGILNACTHGGLVDEGLSCFESMSRDYSIEPQIEHYGCVIDLLGRAGRFEDAMNVVRDMRIEPDEVVWGSLLNGCRIHGDAKLAELAIRKVRKKLPGCSWIEVDSEAYQFYSGDKLHPKAEEICEILEGLAGLMEL